MKKNVLYKYEMIVPIKNNVMTNMDSFAVVLHGPNLDARRHAFPFARHFLCDLEHPFLLVPKKLIDAAIEYGDTLAIVNPVYGEFDEKANERIERVYESFRDMIVFMEHSYSPDFMKNTFPNLNQDEEDDFDDIETVSKEPQYVSRVNTISDFGRGDNDLALDIHSELTTKEHLKELHEKYLTPVETPIGTCYECNAVYVDAFVCAHGFSFLSASVRADGPFVETMSYANYAIFRNALHKYPALWNYLRHEYIEILKDHTDEIYGTHLDLTNDVLNTKLDGFRRDVRNVISGAISTLTDYTALRVKMNSYIDHLSYEELNALLEDCKKKQPTEFGKTVERYTNGILTADAIDNGFKRLFSYRELDPVLDPVEEL